MLTLARPCTTPTNKSAAFESSYGAPETQLCIKAGPLVALTDAMICGAGARAAPSRQPTVGLNSISGRS